MSETLEMPEVNQTQRVGFSDLFFTNADGSISPKVVIEVNGVVIGPGIGLRPGTPIGGVDFFQYLNKDFAVEVEVGRHKLVGYYN
jgi:hypothetical protein